MEVWTLTFTNCDFSDCNGVYSTKEKAMDAFNQHVKRNQNIWLDTFTERYRDNWISLIFEYKKDNYSSYEQAIITKHTLDAI